MKRQEPVVTITYDENGNRKQTSTTLEKQFTWKNGQTFTVQVYDEPWVRPLIDAFAKHPKRLVIDISPKMTGKTTSYKELIMYIWKQRFKAPRIILPGSRRAFAVMIVEDLNAMFKEEADLHFEATGKRRNVEIRIESYLDYPYEKDLSHIECIVIQLDSLKKVEKNPKYDIVIADEILSILRHFSYYRMANPFYILNLFKKILSHADKIIFADADIDTWSLEIFDDLFSESTKPGILR